MSDSKSNGRPGPVYRAGTLVYSLSGLRAVFAWLLAGEVFFVLIDTIEPRLLPILLKYHGATDRQIGIIIGSVNAVLQLLIMPPLGYYSDRLRTRWGRRIPLLFWSTPLASLLLAVTPFAPEITARLMRVEGVAGLIQPLAVAPVVLCFGVLVFLYRSVQTVGNVTFFGLLRDVVPDSHMGRFLALFRLFGAGTTFVITYWLLGYAETHSKPIFIGVALLNLVGFSAICWFVKEGEYPAVEQVHPPEASRWSRTVHAVRVFCRESFRHPIYLYVYLVRTCLYGVHLGLSGFIVFFPQYELGMSLTDVGKALSWSSLLWLVIAYPVGKLIDARGAIPVLQWALGIITVGYLLTYLCVVGPATYIAFSMVTGLAFWVVMLAQLKLAQEVYHPQRYSQLNGANTIVQSIVIAVLVSPLAGWALDALRGWGYSMPIPGMEGVTFGPYRLVNLMMAFLYGLAWFGMKRVASLMRQHTGPNGYVAPL